MKLDARQSVFAALALAAALSAPARAALFDDEEARKRIDATNVRLNTIQKQLEDRIAALESQLKSQGLVELFNQIELLKSDTARLRGQIEVLTYEQQETQKRQRDLYVDLDSRLRKLESAPAAAAAAAASAPPAAGPGAPGATPPGTVAGTLPPASGPAPTATPTTPPTTSAPPQGATPPMMAGTAPRPAAGASATPDPAGEQRAYDAALDLFKNGNYNGAIAAFSAFVRTYARSPLAPSAQYWIGNAQFAQRDFRGAIATQRQLIAAYPDSQKVPDALLNIATSQIEMGDMALARRTLEDLVTRYPQSDAAGRARARLAGR